MTFSDKLLLILSIHTVIGNFWTYLKFIFLKLKQVRGNNFGIYTDLCTFSNYFSVGVAKFTVER